MNAARDVPAPTGGGVVGGTAVSRRAAVRAQRTRVLVGGLAAGAVVLVAAGRTWVRGAAVRPPLPAIVVVGTGRQAAPLAAAGALVAVTGLLALLALRGRVRTIAAWAVVMSGVGIALASLSIVLDPASALTERAGTVAGGTGRVAAVTVSWWPMISLLAGLVVMVAGVMAVVRGSGWDDLAQGYETSGPAGGTVPAAAESYWQAIDRGQDPTDFPDDDPDEGSTDPATGVDPPVDSPTGSPGTNSRDRSG